MTTPSPRSSDSELPDEARDCSRCGFDVCACLRELRPSAAVLRLPEDGDFAPEDDVFLGAAELMRFPAQRYFAPPEVLERLEQLGIDEQLAERVVADAVPASSDESGPLAGEQREVARAKGPPHSRARSGRRAAGGIARRADKPGGDES